MKTFFALPYLSVAVLSLASGCASKPAQNASAHPASAEAASAPAGKSEVGPLPAAPAEPFPGEGWKPLFDGQSLAGWKETAFAGHGDVLIEEGNLILRTGDPFTGLNYTNPTPKMNYEIALDAMRVTGSDFFCGLTVPVGEAFCSLIVGGWGGSLVGISSLDSMDASENETTQFINFDQKRWYRIRLRVTQKKLEAWIDNKKVVNVDTSDRRISVRPGDIEMSVPLGIAAYQSTAAFSRISLRAVEGPDKPPRSK